jgi:micrococcal nuclease
MYEYNCLIRRVIDGDNVEVDIDLGFGVWLKKESIRLYGIDAHEFRTSDPREKVFGTYAKEHVEETLMPFMHDNTPVKLISKKFNKGKYGRILGDLQIGPYGLLAEYLLEAKIVMPYTNDGMLFDTYKDEVEKHLLAEGKVTL